LRLHRGAHILPQQESSSASGAPKNQLLRILGVDFGLAVALGGALGVGILRLPGIVAAQLGSFWPIMLVWAGGGLYSLLGAFSVAELSTMLPQAGGFYVYGKRAYGELVGFAAGWCDWLVNCVPIAYAAFAAAEYLGLLFPKLPGTPRALALMFIAGFTVMHWFGLRISSAVQKVTSASTAITMLVLAAGCFLLGRGAPQSGGVQTIAPAVSSAWHLGLIPMLGIFVLALRAVIVSYDGWYEPIYFTEEDQNPSRNLPRVLIAGVLTVIALYLILNLAFLRALGVPKLAASTLPAADAAQIIFASGSGKFVTILSLLTVLSLMNCLLLSAPRILYAIGRDGLFTRSATVVSAGGTPRAALLMCSAMAAILVCLGNLDSIIDVAAVLMVVLYCAGYGAVFALRWKDPALPRPFRAWGYPWTTSISLGGSVLFLIGAATSDPKSATHAAILLGISVPAYLWRRRSRARAEAAA
jgi:APA family basic amino acid/polyamine antiporter